MQRLQLILATLMISTLAHAQGSPITATPPSPEASGTQGDGWLLTVIAIAFVVVGVGVYMFIRNSKHARM